MTRVLHRNYPLVEQGDSSQPRDLARKAFCSQHGRLRFEDLAMKVYVVVTNSECLLTIPQT